MKHLFSFRQRPNETLTHSTTRGLNGGRTGVETTIKGRSNDCRPTLGRLSTLFLLLFALSFGFNQEVKAWALRIPGSWDGWSTTGSFVYDNSGTAEYFKDVTAGTYTFKVYIDWGGTNQKWYSLNNKSMTDGCTYFQIYENNGNMTFKSTYNARYKFGVKDDSGIKMWVERINPYTKLITTGSNTAYLGDKLGEWNVNWAIYDVGTWTSSKVRIGTSSSSYSEYTSNADGTYENGIKVKANLSGFQFTTTGTYKVFGVLNYCNTKYCTNGENSTQNTNANTAFNNSPLTWTVSAIPAPSNFTATAQSSSSIKLSWSLNTASHNVIIIQDEDDVPTNGTNYNKGDSFGAGKVVYIGNSTSTTISNLAAGTNHTYYIYSVNNGYYSTGSNKSARTYYIVTYKPGQYGTESESFAEKVPSQSLTLKGVTFTRNGYVQDGWATTDGGAKAYELGASYTTDANIILYPTWHVQTYPVTFGVHTSGNGSLGATVGGNAISSGAQVNASATVVFTATPNIGYEVEGWYSDAACSHAIAGAGTGTSYTIPSLAKAETVYVKFKYINYTINFVVDPTAGGTITQPETTPKTDAHYQVPFDIVAQANPGYTFVNWTSTDDITLGVADASSATAPSRTLANAGGGVELQESSSQPATTAALTNVNGTKTITAHFTETMHTVSVVSANTDMGTVSPSSVSAGITTKSGEITATPKPGYYFTGWTASDESKVIFGNAKSETTTANVTADGITITANFAPRFYLRGSSNEQNDPTKGMPGWGDAAKTEGLFSPINGTTATITRTLEAATEYKLKLGDLADGSSWGGTHDIESGDDFWTFTSHDKNCTAPTFKTAIAGTYTFTIDFSEASPKMKITYPDVPDYTLTVTKTRVYEESTLTFIDGDGSENNPYKFYLDEKMHLAITALTPVSGVTAMYQFGGEIASSTTFVKDITGTTAKQSIEVKTYYKAIQGSYVSEKKTETIWYQGVATPALHLTASWNEKEESELSEDPEVTIYYSTDNYAGAAIVTSSVDGAAPTNFMTITTEMQKDQTYQMGNKQPHRYDFKATATINNRTLIATTSVSIYRLVEVRVKDTGHLMSKYYMWINGSNPLQQEAVWPGNAFIGKLGDWHIFLVKYPSYTHFVLNDGQSTGAEQTVDVQLPDHNACYEIGAKGQDNKYAVTEADCPPILYVGNIANVTLHQGESQLITPDVDLDFGYNESQLTITFPNLPSGFTAVQQGKNFMLTGADQCGATPITVKYTLSNDVNSHEETRTFNATVTHPSKIRIQVKVPTSINWNHSGKHDNVYINYWNSNSEPQYGTYDRMTFKTYDSSTASDNYYYSVPLDATGKVCFRVGYPEGMSWDKNERHTVYVNDVTKSGCYSIEPSVNAYGRPINREGDYCWAEYQAIVNMADGTTYYSNKIENTNNYISFYAPGKNETGSKSGLVRILRNETQVGVVPANTFENSGIYIAKIINDGAGLTDVAPYTGDYYICTDGAEGGWKDYKKESHKFTYFTPYEGALYDYYWVQNLGKDGNTLNIKACIGNEYNESLANMIEASNYTDGYGNIKPDAGTGVNLRFGYNPETNYFERSILRGSTVSSNNFLNIVGDNIYNDDDCQKELNEANYTEHPEWSKFGDISNWVYEKNIYVKIDGGHQSAQALLQSKAFNEEIIYQLGYTRDPITGAITSTPAQHDILALGTTQGTYNLRIIYDFKTNRIVSAWSPIEDVTYGDERRINADVLFVRHEDEKVAQVNLSDNNAKVSSLKSAYFVMEIDGATDKASESIYWFSVPFDCYINSIFGVEGYVTLDNNGNPTAGTWGIQEYDGKTRAEKGWYETQTKTFWRWMRKDEKLEKGHGYVLVFDRADANDKSLWKEISREEPCKDTDTDPSCVDGKKTVTTTVLRLYFPSSESGWQMTRSGADQTVTYDDWTCQKKNRKAQDSNWRLLGTDSYSDIMITEEAQFSRSEKDSVLDQAPNFVYEFHPEAEQYRWYVAVSSLNRPFQSFYCYMVQFSGTIKWNQYTQSKPDQQVAARRVVAENELTNAQMTLSLKKGNNTEDNTYIYMDARATTDFDNQMDLTKITDTRANQIYSVIEEVEYAGNTLPVEDQIVPLTVNVNAKGAYTFAMPNMTDGLEVYLIDNTTGSHTDMAIDSYTVDLNKGKMEGRFYLDVRVKERTTPTIIETIGADGNPTGDRFIKVIQNDQLHIIRNGRIYNASGMKLTK